MLPDPRAQKSPAQGLVSMAIGWDKDRQQLRAQGVMSDATALDFQLWSNDLGKSLSFLSTDFLTNRNDIVSKDNGETAV